MEIILGKYAGFCPGVKRAWSLVGKTLQENPGSVFILGELIHNSQALEWLKKQGVRTIKSLNQLKRKRGVVIIRAHGEPPGTFRQLAKMGEIGHIDATCPSVARVQKLAKELETKGYQVIVCGEKEHPEAKATVGYTKKGRIIPSVEEGKKISWTKKIGVLSQTTFSPSLFAEICQILKSKCQEFKSLGTICNFIQQAQKEAKEIAKRVDVVIIVGSKQSSNTRRLAEVTRKIVSTYRIETEKEIKKDWLAGVKKIGLLAGASTPDWVIKGVKKRLEKF